MPDQATGPTGHSPFGMSVLERRMNCPGSAAAEQGRPDRPSDAADYGTRLHDAAAQALLSGMAADDLASLEDDPDGQEIVQAYLEHVRRQHAHLGGQLLVEQRFHLKSLSPLLWGTADAVIVAPPRLAVLDLKTGGHSVPLTREGGGPNLQLAGYALGVLETLPAGVVIERVDLTIVQPRRGMANSITVDALELYDLAVDLVDAIEAAADPAAPLRPGDHCRYCRAAADCPALRQLVQETARTDFEDDGPADPAALDAEELGQVLARAELLDVWIGAVRQHARLQADRGRMPQGYKLVRRRGRRRWVPGQEEGAARLLVNIGVPAASIYTAPQLRSPAQCEAEIKRARKPPPAPEVWAQLIETSDPGIALVPVTDPRPAIAAGPAADFEDIDPLS